MRFDDVGFGTGNVSSGESTADFEKTFDCLARWPITYFHPLLLGPTWIRGESFGDQVPGGEKSVAHERSNDCPPRHRIGFKRYLGKRVEVLVEAATKR